MAINQQPNPHMRGVAPARYVAVRVLLALETGAATDAAEALDYEIGAAGLDRRDASLATALVYITLRRQRLLDLQYRAYLTKPPSKLSPELRVLLRMAAAQRFFFERVPPHAIANDAVEAARRVLRLNARDTGFLNAVVRRLVAAPDLRQATGEDELERLAVQHSYPRWLAGQFDAKYGRERTRSLLEAANEEPRSTLRVNSLRIGREELVQRLAEAAIEATPTEIAPGGLVLTTPGSLRTAIESPLFAEGLFYVQDEASQLVALIAQPRQGERILDLCSAPGGKCTHCAEIVGGKARVDATDISAERLNDVRENVQRLASPNLHVVDYADILHSPGDYDLVLVDAPCSGLGTIRRNPEIRYRCSAPALERFAHNQGELLEVAARRTRPGGRIVYSTCSMTDEENRAVAAAFIAKNPAFHVDSTPHPNAAIDAMRGEDGFYRTWPEHPEMDGFEAVVLRRERS
jgi:16S rRNA (cytosine967-C5)-methyltransferase